MQSFPEQHSEPRAQHRYFVSSLKITEPKIEPEFSEFFSSVRSPNVVPLLVLLTHDTDLQPIAADRQIAPSDCHLFLAQVAMKMQMNLILVHRAVQLRIENHRRWTYVILAWIVVVALVVRIVIVRGDWNWRSRSRRPGTVVITWTTAACPAARENIWIAGLGGYQW